MINIAIEFFTCSFMFNARQSGKPTLRRFAACYFAAIGNNREDKFFNHFRELFRSSGNEWLLLDVSVCMQQVINLSTESEWFPELGKDSDIKKWTKESTYRLVVCAMMIALSIVLTRFCSWQPVPFVRIGLGALPIMFAGALCGPVAGFVVGIAADLVGYIFNPMGGALFLGLTLCSGFNGVFTGIFCKYIFKKTNIFSVLSGVAATELLVSVGMKSVCFVYLYGSTFLTYAVPKLWYALIMIVVETLLIWLLMKVLQKSKVLAKVY